MSHTTAATTRMRRTGQRDARLTKTAATTTTRSPSPSSTFHRGMTGGSSPSPTATGGGLNRTSHTATTTNAMCVTRKQRFAEAADGRLTGHRAAAWLKAWDSGSRAAREQILLAFLALHAESTSAALEADLGDAAALFFTRITSWLRLTYRSAAAASSASAATGTTARTKARKVRGEAQQTLKEMCMAENTNAVLVTATTSADAAGAASAAPPTSASASPSSPAHANRDGQQGGGGGGQNAVSSLLVLLVKSITVFVRGSHYLTLLVEAGVAATLTDCLECGTQPVTRRQMQTTAESHSPSFPLSSSGGLSVEERRAILLLLLFAANAGRVYREIICEEDGIVHLLHALQREQEDEGIAGLITELLLVLCQGNPRTAPSIHTGLLRVVEAATGSGHRLSTAAASSFTAPYPAAEREGTADGPSPSRPTTGRAGDEEPEQTVMVDSAVHAARALRELQMYCEAHHMSKPQTAPASSSPVSSTGGGGGAEDSTPILACPDTTFAPSRATTAALKASSAAQPSAPSALPWVGVSASPPALPSAAPAMTSPPSNGTAHATTMQLHPLLTPFTRAQYLDVLIALATHPSLRLRAEGVELLTLAARNVQLARPIVTACLDVMEETVLAIEEREDVERRLRHQRRQVSCGQAVVQILLCLPRSVARQTVLFNVVLQRSACPLLLTTYLPLIDPSDTMALLACFRAVQWAVRMALEVAQQRANRGEWRAPVKEEGSGGGGGAALAVQQLGQAVSQVVGDHYYHTLLYEELSTEDVVGMREFCLVSLRECE